MDRVFGLGRSGNFSAIGFRVPKCEARGDLLYRLSYVTENNSFQVLIHNEELNDFCPSPNTVRVIKSRRMRWAGHVARMGETRGCIGSWWGNRRKGDHWGDLGQMD